jgi:hypothetical protein
VKTSLEEQRALRPTPKALTYSRPAESSFLLLAEHSKSTRTRSGCWKGWINSVQQDSIKAPVPKLDAILVMRDEGVHRALHVARYQERIAMNASTGIGPQDFQSFCTGNGQLTADR